MAKAIPNDCRIDFESLPWQSPMPGVRFKAYVQGGRTMRLVEFTEKLKEPDWCRKGHIGWVLEGRVTIDFDGTPILFEAGDGLFIEPGERDRHMASIAPGERALLILIEEA